VDLRLTFGVSPIDFDGVGTPPAPAEVEGLTRADLTELSSAIDAAVRLSTEPGSVGKGRDLSKGARQEPTTSRRPSRRAASSATPPKSADSHHCSVLSHPARRLQSVTTCSSPLHITAPGRPYS